MFGQLKELNELRRQGQQLKKEMEKISVEVREKEVKIVMRGDQQVESIEVEGTERDDLKKAFNKAVKESQKKVAKKLSGALTGMKLPGIG